VPNVFEIHPIGIVHSPFTQAQGTPVQPFAAAQMGHGAQAFNTQTNLEEIQVDVNGGCGSLEIHAEWIGALQDLDGFSHIWVLFWCNQANQPKPKVLPYRDTIERGLFATRVPARPNPIGISCVRIRAVHGRMVHVSEMDMLDGTPIVDIKPYVPEYDVREGVQRGWLASPSARTGVVLADGRFAR
jgi:tRNA-Thr(GGU) m(6)t(6)A37 methyltransferase TsaA